MHSIQVISDIHSEFGLSPDKFRNLLVPADFTLLAGDVVTSPSYLRKYLEVAKEFSKHVIFVCGNHEYYKGYTEDDYIQIFTEIASDGESAIHFLNRDRICIEGIWFTGATLWSNISDYAAKMMNDPLTADQIRSKHLLDLDWLNNNMLEGDIVITHHLPSLLLIHPKYAGSLISSGFATYLNEHISRLKPLIWICGHTHTPFDIIYDRTRLVVNPVGYPGENKEFKPMIIYIKSSIDIYL
ncbi:MAG: metallophosphoesterase [Candidatus Paceibacterota bacterium]